VGKTLALRRYVDSLNENLFKPCYTPLSTLSVIGQIILAPGGVFCSE
jgi:hypothetical protein